MVASVHWRGWAHSNALGLRCSVGYVDGAADDPLARPHAPDGYYWSLRANGGLLSTAADLARWSDALLGGEVLGPDALETYLTPHVREGLGQDFHYAYGWEISETEVGRLVSHTGGNGFFFASVRQYVDAGLLVIVLSNAANEDVYRLPFDLAHAALPALPSSDDLPRAEPFALERTEEIDASSESFVEAIDFGVEHDRAVAGFFADLTSGSAQYRLLTPGGEAFAQGRLASGAPAERLLVVPPRRGRWQLAIDTEAATGAVGMGWAWDD